MDDFKAQYEESTGKKPEPVKSYLAVFGKGSKDTEFYKAMFEELVKLEPLDEKALFDLGNRRSKAIVDTLTAVESLDETRATAGDSGPAEKASDSAVPTKLELEVIRVPQHQETPP